MLLSKPSPQQERPGQPAGAVTVSAASLLCVKSLEIPEGSCSASEAPLGGRQEVGELVPYVFILCSKSLHWAPEQGPLWGFL